MRIAKLIRQIGEGWTNSLLNQLSLLSPAKKQVAEERLAICLTCPIRTNSICDPAKKGISPNGTTFEGCGCFIEKKTMCMDCECPGQYWMPVNL
jgi:hypothetical protein